jgi:hypothetical protein
MATYSQRDQVMLTEAYTLQLLKESIPTMTLNQVHSNLDFMSESELEYVATVSDRLLEGFFGNVGAGLKNVGRGVAKGASNVAGQAAQAVGNKVGQAVQGAKQVGSGLAAGAKQIGSNAADMYQTGVADKKSQDALVQARTSTQQLIDLITQAQQSGILGNVRGNVADMSLSEIIDTLDAVKQSTGDFAQAATNKGFTGGAGQAFRQGFQS